MPAVLRPNELSIWFSKAEVWPIIVCIGGALGWTSYMSGRYVTASPNMTSITCVARCAGRPPRAHAPAR
jgi:hypothetical protein